MKTKSILIVGGGTAGWMTAAYLAKALGTVSSGGPVITLIESEEIGIVGVGEGTFPTIRMTLAAIGIDEARFMRACNATFKQGIRFVDWEEAPRDGAHRHYFHPFNFPHQAPGMELLPYWILGCADPALSYAEATGVQQQVAETARAPKRIIDTDYSGPMNYAYHFDAGKLASLLRDVGKELGVHHLTGLVTGVEMMENGEIAAIQTDRHGRLTADLFIDCSGFRAELIGKTLKVPFHNCNDVLLTNRAVAIQTPYERPDAPIASYTISTAHESGWSWDIGLNSRRGIGYVYSSRHSSADRAEEVLRAHVGPVSDGINARHLSFEAGYRDRQWVGNCVAVGLSGSFFEPLESTGIMLIEIAAHLIAQFFPWSKDSMGYSANAFNAMMGPRFERIVDFLKLHYCLSKRPEPFWQDNANPDTIPESLREKLAMWRHRPPSRFDFVSDHETFLPFSYQYILYGMGYVTNLEASRSVYRGSEIATNRFKEIQKMLPSAMAELPLHRTLVEQIYRFGLQPKQLQKVRQ